MRADLSQVFELTAPEKLQLVQDLWDSLAADTVQVPLLDWQKQELDRRKASAQQPTAGHSWEEVQARVLGQHGA